VAVVSVRGRISSMRGSAVSMLSCVVSGDACACVQALVPVLQPDQRQLSVGGVRAVVVDVRVMCCAWVCLCMGGVRYACTDSVHLLLCVRALHVWCCVSQCVGARCGSCTSMQWVCGPWWVVSAVVAVVSVRERNSSMRGSAVWTPAVVVSGDAFACVCRRLGLAGNQISGSFPSVVSGLSSLTCVGCVLCVFASAWAVACGVWCTPASVCACAACVVLRESVCRCEVRGRV
jgi:hypothetical protein